MTHSSAQIACLNYLTPPKEQRGFKSDSEFADSYNINVRTVRRWKTDEDFIAELDRRREQFDSAPSYANYIRKEAAMDVLHKGTLKAGKEQRQFAKDLNAALGDTESPGETLKYEAMSDSELVAAICGEHITVRGIEDSTLREMYETLAGDTATS